MIHHIDLARDAINTTAAHATAEALRKWIHAHLIGVGGVVDGWVHTKVESSGEYWYRSEEMMEYRRLWLCDMITYWESKGD